MQPPNELFDDHNSESHAAPHVETIAGFRIWRSALGPDAQQAVVDAVRSVIGHAPLVRPLTAWGKPMSVRMTSAGRVGWVIDRGRYRYVTEHPETGQAWPAIPDRIAGIWRQFCPDQPDPDCCLINWYAESARMGLHRDADEGDFSYPVLSVSLGDPARFRMGGPERGDPTRSTILKSGDVVVMGGAARLAYHGIDRILFGDGDLLPGGGRINLTLRVVSQ